MFCNKCGAEMRDDSQFCSRCGSSVRMTSTHQGAQPRIHLNEVPTFLVVALIVVGGFSLLWSSLPQESRSRIENRESVEATGSAVRLKQFVALCDAIARNKLSPDTIEFVREPETYDLNTIITATHEIAARDKSGVRNRYRCVCTAPADGRGGFGNVSVELIPTND